MNNLVELKKEELKEVEGGWGLIILGAILLDAAINYEDSIASIRAGYALARQ